MSELLQSIEARGVATLTLNRPGRHNAFDDALVGRLTAALHALGDRADVRVVVLRGAGKSFCAGGDIDWMKRLGTATDEANLADAEALASLFLTLDRLSKPTIAYVHGAAFGGGVGLVACCDIAIATEDARFCLSEAGLGVIPAAVGPYVLRAMSARATRRLMLTAEVFAAQAAKELGLVHEVVSDAEGSAECDRLIDALLACAPGAQREIKSLLAYCDAHPIGEELARETARRLAEKRASQEGREGLSAFIEKRAPKWRSGP
ncbi:MAG TPA: enoyl-CoA hydratase-related protein [Methylocystis sp.]|nr:enoyl-CoA hydratase-related protein [Methylocystis sp.]